MLNVHSSACIVWKLVWNTNVDDFHFSICSWTLQVSEVCYNTWLYVCSSRDRYRYTQQSWRKRTRIKEVEKPLAVLAKFPFRTQTFPVWSLLTIMLVILLKPLGVESWLTLVKKARVKKNLLSRLYSWPCVSRDFHTVRL